MNNEVKLVKNKIIVNGKTLDCYNDGEIIVDNKNHHRIYIVGNELNINLYLKKAEGYIKKGKKLVVLLDKEPSIEKILKHNNESITSNFCMYRSHDGLIETSLSSDIVIKKINLDKENNEIISNLWKNNVDVKNLSKLDQKIWRNDRHISGKGDPCPGVSNYFAYLNGSIIGHFDIVDFKDVYLTKGNFSAFSVAINQCLDLKYRKLFHGHVFNLLLRQKSPLHASVLTSNYKSILHWRKNMFETKMIQFFN